MLIISCPAPMIPEANYGRKKLPHIFFKINRTIFVSNDFAILLSHKYVQKFIVAYLIHVFAKKKIARLHISIPEQRLCILYSQPQSNFGSKTLLQNMIVLTLHSIDENNSISSLLSFSTL